MNLCPPCTTEYQDWLTAGYLPGERTEYTLTDKRADLTRLNHERWKTRIQTQLRLIRDHCTRNHAPLTVPHIDEHCGRAYETPSIINTHNRKEDGPANGNHENPIPQARVL